MHPKISLSQRFQQVPRMLILAELHDQGPLHGYVLAKNLEADYPGEFSISEATLYPALHALEHDELIRGAWEQQTSGKLRRVYTITAAGISELEQGTRLASFLERLAGRLKRRRHVPST